MGFIIRSQTGEAEGIPRPVMKGLLYDFGSVLWDKHSYKRFSNIKFKSWDLTWVGSTSVLLVDFTDVKNSTALSIDELEDGVVAMSSQVVGDELQVALLTERSLYLLVTSYEEEGPLSSPTLLQIGPTLNATSVACHHSNMYIATWNAFDIEIWFKASNTTWSHTKLDMKRLKDLKFCCWLTAGDPPTLAVVHPERMCVASVDVLSGSVLESREMDTPGVPVRIQQMESGGWLMTCEAPLLQNITQPSSDLFTGAIEMEESRDLSFDLDTQQYGVVLQGQKTPNKDKGVRFQKASTETPVYEQAKLVILDEHFDIQHTLDIPGIIKPDIMAITASGHVVIGTSSSSCVTIFGNLEDHPQLIKHIPSVDFFKSHSILSFFHFPSKDKPSICCALVGERKIEDSSASFLSFTTKHLYNISLVKMDITKHITDTPKEEPEEAVPMATKVQEEGHNEAVPMATKVQEEGHNEAVTMTPNGKPLSELIIPDSSSRSSWNVAMEMMNRETPPKTWDITELVAKQQVSQFKKNTRVETCAPPRVLPVKLRRSGEEDGAELCFLLCRGQLHLQTVLRAFGLREDELLSTNIDGREVVLVQDKDGFLPIDLSDQAEPLQLHLFKAF